MDYHESHYRLSPLRLVVLYVRQPYDSHIVDGVDYYPEIFLPRNEVFRWNTFI